MDGSGLENDYGGTHGRLSQREDVRAHCQSLNVPGVLISSTILTPNITVSSTTTPQRPSQHGSANSAGQHNEYSIIIDNNGNSMIELVNSLRTSVRIMRVGEHKDRGSIRRCFFYSIGS